MGTTPKVDKKPKYNKDDKFRWVDSQWEKFMTEQTELKSKIKALEEDNENLLEENEMMRSFLPPDDFHMGHDEFYDIVDEYKHKYKRKYKSLKAKYKALKKKVEKNPRGDEWRIEQFNRNRAPEDQVHTIQEMSDRVEDLYNVNHEKYIYESPDGGNTIYRRELGKSDREKISE